MSKHAEFLGDFTMDQYLLMSDPTVTEVDDDDDDIEVVEDEDEEDLDDEDEDEDWEEVLDSTTEDESTEK